MVTQGLAALVIVFSGFINALTGFGFIIVAAPFLVYLLPPKQVAATALVLGLIISLVIAYRERATINLRVAVLMALAAVFGVPLGAAVLNSVSAGTLKILVGAIVIAVTLPMTRGFRLPARRQQLLSLLSGFLSGVLSGVCGMSGAIAALFFTGYAWEPSHVRPTIAAFNAMTSSVTLAWLFLSGTIGREELWSALLFLPLVLLGLLLSNVLRLRVDRRHFRSLTFLLVLIAGTLALLSGLFEKIR
jgi:uncharacterized membrane protein YfcA